MLEAGSKPADFTLNDQDGKAVSWKEYRGKPVVVFFYPKADTPGCTREACAFRDLTSEFDKRGVRILGISADVSKDQAKFRQKYDLTMPLLADPDHVVLEPWGVWGEKKNYGKTYMGIHRTTFLFDKDGKVAHAWTSVKVDGHAEKVLAKVDDLFGAKA